MQLSMLKKPQIFGVETYYSTLEACNHIHCTLIDVVVMFTNITYLSHA